MEIHLQKKYDPLMDCYILLKSAYEPGCLPPASCVERNLELPVNYRGLPIEELRVLTAPAAELERYIMERLPFSQERLRYYFSASSEGADNDLAQPLMLCRKAGVDLEQLEEKQRQSQVMWVIHVITKIDQECLDQLKDLGALVSLLDDRDLPDHVIRVCLSFYRDPVGHQKELNAILDEAMKLYKRRMKILPKPEEVGVETLNKSLDRNSSQQKWDAMGLRENQRVQVWISAFVYYCIRYFGMLNPLDPNDIYILSGVWDDEMDKLRRKYGYTVPKLAQEIKSFADPRRLEMLGAIRDDYCSVEQLSKQFGMSTSLLSYHLGQMQREQMLILERRKNNNYYRLNYPVIQRMLHNLRSYLRVPDEILEEEDT